MLLDKGMLMLVQCLNLCPQYLDGKGSQAHTEKWVIWGRGMLSVVFIFTRHLGLDLVPRKDFEVVDSDQISVSDLYKMVSNRTMGSLFTYSSFFSPFLFSFMILWNSISKNVPFPLLHYI